MDSEEKMLRKLEYYSNKLERRRRKAKRSRTRERESRASRPGPKTKPCATSRSKSSRRSRSPVRRSYSKSSRRSQSPVRRSRSMENYTPKEPDNQEEDVSQDPPPVQNPDIELIEVLGKEYNENIEFEGHIDENISKRWSCILAHGLNKIEKDDILKNTKLPQNCQLLDAPILNEEVASVISESGRNRDKSINYQQKQLGVAITLVGKVMTNIMKSNLDKAEMLKKLSEASKLFTDLHHQKSKTRKMLVAPQ